MSAIKTLNPNAEQLKKGAALYMNINAAKGLQDVMRSNLGPKGTLKMLVGGSGDIKLTKDGNTLLREMQIQNPTALMIARTATAQDDICGDGTTGVVLLIGELLKQAERYLSEGVHPRILVDGFEIAKKACTDFMETAPLDIKIDRATALAVARSSLSTKVHKELSDQLANVVTDAVLCVHEEGKPIDTNMIETIHMRHKLQSDSKLVRGLVMDHGVRHPDMPKHVENCYVLSCNVSLEYEKSEINSSFLYSNADQRASMVEAERKYTDDRCRQIIALKHKVCGEGKDTEKKFVIVNQKGIDPLSLEMFVKEGIFALRRAKKRNMERLIAIAGGDCAHSLDDLDESVLGWAGKVYEHTVGEEAYTFVEDCKETKSCTILVKGADEHSIDQVKQAVRDGIRSVKNALEDGKVLAGGGAIQIALHRHLTEKVVKETSGRAKLGVLAFADSLLIVPKALAENAGFDAQDSIISMQEEAAKGAWAGLNLDTGEVMDPVTAGVFDCFNVTLQAIISAPIIASQILLVDEILRAGRDTRPRQ